MEKELKFSLKSLILFIVAIIFMGSAGVGGYFLGQLKATIPLGKKNYTYQQINKVISSKTSELKQLNDKIASDKSDEQTLQSRLDDLNSQIESTISDNSEDNNSTSSNSDNVSVTTPASGYLDSGTYLVGTDIGASRYKVTVQNPCSILISEDNKYVSSYLLGNGSNSATFTLKNGETVQFNNSVTIEPIK